MGVMAVVIVLMINTPLYIQGVSAIVNMTFNLGLIWMTSFTGLVVAAAYSEQGAGDRYAYLAQHDGLTRLINRSTFEQRLEQAIQHAKREGRAQVHALMFIDLDDFKLINDQFGHATGDLVLRRLSDLLLSHVRSRDTVARLGGDEFVVLLERCSVDCSRQMAERIATAIRGMLIPVENGNCQITASIGVTPVGDNTGTLESVLSAADAAHYRAKEEGKNQVHYRYGDRVTDEC
jgi:diguanylate cyclase (GGDEF)-like protein